MLESRLRVDRCRPFVSGDTWFATASGTSTWKWTFEKRFPPKRCWKLTAATHGLAIPFFRAIRCCHVNTIRQNSCPTRRTMGGSLASRARTHLGNDKTHCR
ncbi:MAG: hypothetical protein HY698_21800 [Deltaproteobacteria bacterium]|nr:hypothetical protein [Deltaproteobacteria bacterium]